MKQQPAKPPTRETFTGLASPSRPGFSSDFFHPSLPLVASPFPRHTLSLGKHSLAFARYAHSSHIGFLLGPSRTGTRPGPGPLHPAPHGPSTALGPAPRSQHCPSARATAPLPALGRLALLPTHAAPRSSFGSGPPRCPTRNLRHGPRHATCHTPLSLRLGPPQPDQETATRQPPPGHNTLC